jgi:hypothetical protein
MTGKIELKVSEDDDSVAYVYLPEHPGPGKRSVVAKQVRLSSLLTYKGPDIVMDLDNDGRLIGIEVIG